MSRYINTETLKELFERYPQLFISAIEGNEEARKILEDTIRDSSIELIHCKECKHREWECRWDTNRRLPTDNDFCSGGEKDE